MAVEMNLHVQSTLRMRSAYFINILRRTEGQWMKTASKDYGQSSWPLENTSLCDKLLVRVLHSCSIIFPFIVLHSDLRMFMTQV
jgi:hypothetical protein